MKAMAKLWALMMCVLVLAGCAESALPTQTGATDTNSVWQPVTQEETLYVQLFDLNNKIELVLDMPEEEIAKMQADYERYDGNGSKSPIYRKANLTVFITTPQGEQSSFFLEEVGVRMKGNTSRTSFYNAEEGIYNIIHLKLSFQETFDDPDYYGSEAQVWTDAAREARKNRTFATLEKLDLRWNRCDDGSYLKEYFAYETYRQYGVLAPRTNLCSFDWAGIHMGVFTINEPIDQKFLEKNLPQEALGGDLYKIGWAGSENGCFLNTNSIGIEDEAAGEFYAYDLKTNKKTSQHDALKNLIRSLNSGNVTKEQFSQLLDAENFVSFAAVSYLLGNPDDLRNNYNNCYLYFRADTGQAMFIPYDFDRCLGVTAHWNPTGDGVTGDNPFANTLAATGQQQKSPVMLYSVVSGGYFVEEYAKKLQEIAAGEWFTTENFHALYSVAEYHYASLAQPGKQFHNTYGLHLSFDVKRSSDFASNGNISFQEYWEAKQKTLAYYLQDIPGGEPMIPAVWYIRADATGWQNDDDYAMEAADGLVCITIHVSGEMRLKVYNDQTGRWYGAECVAEDCSVAFESDGHTNIVLKQGTYRIVFDTETEIITLEKE